MYFAYFYYEVVYDNPVDEWYDLAKGCHKFETLQEAQAWCYENEHAHMISNAVIRNKQGKFCSKLIQTT